MRTYAARWVVASTPRLRLLKKPGVEHKPGANPGWCFWECLDLEGKNIHEKERPSVERILSNYQQV